MTGKAPYRLLYNNDTTNTVGCISPWHEAGQPFREKMLVASIEEVADKNVDCYLLSPGMGWVPWWQSKVEPDYYDWWRKRTGLPLPSFPGYDKYIDEGGDMVRVLVETCRKHGMAPFVSLRMNDTHHQENYVLKNERSLVSCRFYVEHPEWHLDPEHPRLAGYQKVRGMDWAVPEVRAHKLALIEELAANYDLDGIELDFLRDETLFRTDGPDEATRIDILSGFVARVRDALDAGGRTRHLGVRIPLRIDCHAQSGFDVKRLRKVGVDMFNLSGWFHTTQLTDVAKVREQVPDVAIYLEMTHSTSWYPHFTKPGLYGTAGDPRTSPEQFYATTRLARARGADGMSLFNFVYYRQGPNLDVPVMEPPFHLLPRLVEDAFLARQAQIYMTGSCVYDWQLPREIKDGQPITVKMDMLVQPACTPDGRLRLHTKEPLPSDARLSVTFNGEALAPCADVSRFFGNPFDPMISPPGHRLAWVLPGGSVLDGINTVRLEGNSADGVMVTYVDVGFPGSSGRS